MEFMCGNFVTDGVESFALFPPPSLRIFSYGEVNGGLAPTNLHQDRYVH